MERHISAAAHEVSHAECYTLDYSPYAAIQTMSMTSTPLALAVIMAEWLT